MQTWLIALCLKDIGPDTVLIGPMIIYIMWDFGSSLNLFCI